MLATGVRIFSTRTGLLLTPDTKGGNEPSALVVTFSRDGKTLVTGGGLIRYWDVATLLRP
jgi:WD40 repeat protein